MEIRFVGMFLAALLVFGCVGEPAPMPDDNEPAPAAAAAEGLENGSFSAELNSFKIHYEVHGQGPVVMTVPNSWGLSLKGLRVLYEPLERYVTMVYFDPRGMGGIGSDPRRCRHGRRRGAG